MATQIRIAEHSLLSIVHSPEVKQLFAEKKRDDLQNVMSETFNDLKSKGIDQLQFHTPNAHSFLRVHQPEKHSDDLSSFRHTVVKANADKDVIKGLEEGVAGYGFRVVAPIEYQGTHIGTVEVGNNFGEQFLNDLKTSVDGEHYIYSFTNDEDTYLAATNEADIYEFDERLLEEMKETNGAVSTYSGDKKKSILLIPFYDYEGEMKGFIKSVVSRVDALTHMNKLITNAIVTGLSSLIIVFIAIFYLISTITRPITAVAQSMISVADKDLTAETIKVNTNDEVGQLANSLNSMIDNLRDTLNSVNQASEHVAASSEQLLASSLETTRASEQVSLLTQKSAERTERQLQNINEVTVTIEEMSSGLEHVLSDSEQLVQKAEDVTEVVHNGNKSVNDVLSQMTLIDESVDHLSSVIQNLNNRTNEIDKIVQFITDIADQTNLLALNAAIEASRAGEAGQGFAVVADEVRKLAEESSNSAIQIMKLIKVIHEETERAVTLMGENTDKVNAGLEIADNVKEAFKQIEDSITDVNEFTEEVTSSFEQMAAGSSQIVETVDMIKKVAEDNAASDMDTSAASEEQVAAMEEVASAAEVLSKLALELQAEINEFKV